jgi:hypothetical protein
MHGKFEDMEVMKAMKMIIKNVPFQVDTNVFERFSKIS